MSSLIGFSKDWLLIPTMVPIALLLSKNSREGLRFIGLCSRNPASGFIAVAIILSYVFAEFFGSRTFWEASLEGEVPANLPEICSSYLELLACYFILVGVIGFTLPLKKGRENL